MYIDSVDFLFHDLSIQEADELFRLAQLEIFDRTCSSLFMELDKYPLLVAWVEVAKMQGNPASFHLTFPSRALISVAANYKTKLIEAEERICDDSDYWNKKE